MSPQIYFLNGPNANLYGLDKSGTYGSESFVSLGERCQRRAGTHGVILHFRQSNLEGVLVDWDPGGASARRRVNYQRRGVDLQFRPHTGCIADV